MRLHIEDNVLYAGSTPLETGLTVEARADKLVQMGAKPDIALSIAHGELSTPTRAKLLGIRAGLLAVETDEARKRRLLR
jgi:hypothetical protein